MLRFFLCFCLMASSCFGMVVTVNLTWSAPLSSYNIQEGSIVQIIAYDHQSAARPPSGASGNFSEVAPNIYDPYSLPQNHEIVSETSVIGGQATSTFLLDDFTRIYVRIFYTENFSEEVSLSYWGLSSVRNIPQNGKPFTTVWANLPAPNFNSFSSGYFEVIPEPTTLSLVLTGTVLFGMILRKIKVYPRI